MTADERTFEHPDPSTLPMFAEPVPSQGSGTATGMVDGHPMRSTLRGDWGTPERGSHDKDDEAAAVDWSLVAQLRAQASQHLSQAVAAEQGLLDQDAQQELGRAIVLDLVEQEMAESVNAGGSAWSLAKQTALARSVFDALFRLGRLQPLVDDDRVENIVITGYDSVWLQLIDGTLVAGPRVADSDAELIEFLVFLASRTNTSAREFSEAHPRLHLQLEGGARLAATAWVTPRPAVVIRRHRLMVVTLDDLVERAMLTPVAASFLRAAVRARRSIVVSGTQRAGKTTLVRALCHEFDQDEVIGTFETERELNLQSGHHKVVIPWESRPGTGERAVGGRRAGEFTVDDALLDSFRFSLSRQVVGEVRGPEVWAMIKAMESGPGSLSTTHAADAVTAIRKLMTCAMEAGHVTPDVAIGKLATTIDLIVQLAPPTATSPDKTEVQRRVSEIIAVEPGEQLTGYATTHVFAPDDHGVAMPKVLPDVYRALVTYGFDLPGYLHGQERMS